ncbi:hypothetical protein NUW58_g3784 [Xylaria curta]|uniref:Uncharacterized protein n=1 Tax=Xylaria curta TaxID=42375 RepID=A0ACC1PAZ6_9PEZI|nr:hypothetical protein NUW58_g3784 [Xylaria curta]
MKCDGRYPDRLSKALNKIKHLEDENARLHKELTASRTQRTLARPRHTPPSTNITTPKDTHHYALPTISSRRKSNSQSEEPKKVSKTAPRPVHIGNKAYVYKDGVPIPQRTISELDNSPKYMMHTSSSLSRKYAILDEQWERTGKRAFNLNLGDWGTWDPPKQEVESLIKEVESPTKEDAETEKAVQTIVTTLVDMVEVDLAVEDLAMRSRLRYEFCFGGQLVFIDTRKGLEFLRRTAEAVQKAIYSFGKGGRWNWNTRNLDGPHLVRLGRDEMIRWMRYNTYSFASPQDKYCDGFCFFSICRALFDVVPLRNAMCHPEGYVLRDAERLDRLLSDAQLAVVLMNDEKHAMEIREIRDELRIEGEKSMQNINDLYYLVILPFYEASCQQRDSKVLEEALRRPDYTEWEEIVAVAEAWDGLGRPCV